MRKALEKARNNTLKEKKATSDKLTDNIQARRKDGKCWYVHMDRLYRKHGVKREDYHKRKFSGRPLQQIKRAATNMLADARVLLREHKEDGVLDSEIDELCDEVESLLTSSLHFFEAILKFPATDADVNDAEQKKGRFMELVRKSDVLKGNITVKGHIIDVHSIGCMKKCKQLNIPFSKILEQFVELNHQTGKRLDEQSKRITNAVTMANSMCKKKALDYNAEINKQITRVHEDGQRGKYNKDPSVALAATDLLASAHDPGPDEDLIADIGMVDGNVEEPTPTEQQPPTGNSNSPMQSVNPPAVSVAVTPRKGEKRVAPGDGSVVHIRLLPNFKKGKHC